MTQTLSPRPVTVGTFPIRTRQATWRSFRERSLLKEFMEYKDSKKKLKVFRLEAVRAGFKKAWQDRDYETIISVAEKNSEPSLGRRPQAIDVV